MKVLSNLARKGKLAVAGAIFAVGVLSVGTVAFSQHVYAASCDKVNIVYCGLSGSDDSGYIKSLQSLYHKNSDNGHTDLQAVYNWAGLGDANINAMDTSNTKIGTMYRNGDIEVDGKVVAHDAWVSARFTSGNGFVKVKDGVWARKTTTSLAEDSAKVIVHFKSDGTFDGAVMVTCGNAVKATPVPPKSVPQPKPQPKPALACTQIKGAATATAREFNFTANASASNTKIVAYTFVFRDSANKTVATKVVETSATTASQKFTFPEYGKSYSATVYVSSTDIKNVTNNNCKVNISTPPAPVKPELVCDSLVVSPVLGKDLTYKFTASANANKTTITSFVFNFDDGHSTTLQTSTSPASTTHTYATNSKSYTATVTVNSTDIPNKTSVDCKVTFTTPKPTECKPGIPKGDERCTECMPGVQEGQPECTPTTPEQPLPNTGPGAVAGLFAGTSVLGAATHQVVRRRLNRTK